MMDAKGEGTMRRCVGNLRPAPPSPLALRPIRRTQPTRQRTGWAIALLAVSVLAPGASSYAGTAPLMDFLGGEQGVALPAGAAERLGETGALDRILGSGFDRIEIFHGDELARVLAVARVESSTADLGAQRARIAAALVDSTTASQEAANRSTMSFAAAMAAARDPNASPDERQRAFAALAASGQGAAVDTLRDVAAGEVGTEAGRMALLALGGFAGSETAPIAVAALAELAKAGAVDPVDLFRAQAAYDMTPLVADFQATIDTSVRYRKLQAAANGAGSAVGLTDFYIAALQDRSTDIVRTAAMDMGRQVDRLDSGRIIAALELVAENHRSRNAQEGAKIGLHYASMHGREEPLSSNFLQGGRVPRAPSSGSVTKFGQ